MGSVKFTRLLDEGIKKMGAMASKEITTSGKLAWRTAVDATPRDTGTAQAGWKLSNKRRGSHIPKRRRQARPKTPNFRFRVTKDSRIYLYNNVPYISYINDGKGPGVRVPHNMMRKARARLESELVSRLKGIKV